MTIGELKDYLNSLDESVMDKEVYLADVYDLGCYSGDLLSISEPKKEQNPREGLYFEPSSVSKDSSLMLVNDNKIEKIEDIMREEDSVEISKTVLEDVRDKLFIYQLSLIDMEEDKEYDEIKELGDKLDSILGDI